MRFPVLLLAAWFWIPDPANAQTIVLGYRPGGMLMEHVREADRWLKSGAEIEVTDWQMSSAALQIVYFYRHGGTVCYRDSDPLAGAFLQFHQPQSNGIAVTNYRGVFVHFMGEEITAMIGPVEIDTFKPIHASAIGIPLCESKLVEHARDSRTQ